MSDSVDFFTRFGISNVRFLRPRGGPTITKCCRLRGVNEGHYDEFFEIVDYRDINGKLIIDVTYLPDVKCCPRRFLYKSGTVKMGGFFNIKDICEKHFGPEPEDGWHYNLTEIQRDDSRHNVKYMVLE